MIPDFDQFGKLPPGVYTATIDEVSVRYGINDHRRKLLEGFKAAVDALRKAGCKTIYLDGSFITDKAFPKDYDCCWEPMGVDISKLDLILMDFSNGRQRQKLKFKGEFFVASNVALNIPRLTFLEFFQQDRDGQPKGIIQIKL